jgi:apolipoprotein N-acyltransferase
MTAIACAVLTAVGFFFSLGLGEQWWLAWLAPIPVLWFAFGETRTWQAFLAAWAGFALGSTSVLQAYAGLLPVPVLVLGIVVPSLLFALAVLAGRIVARRIAPLAGALVFAALWAGFDFLVSFNTGGGAVQTPAIAEVFAPVLAQSASLVGAWGITFLLGFVPAGIAASLRTRTALPAGVAVAVFVANAAFGYLRMAPPSETVRTALINTDAMQRAVDSNNEADTRNVIDAYVRAIRALKDDKVRLIVLPEKIEMVQAAWQGEAKRKLAEAAAGRGAVLVAGFDGRDAKGAHNESWAFTPGAPSRRSIRSGALSRGWSLSSASGRGRWRSATGPGWKSARTWIFRR